MNKCSTIERNVSNQTKARDRRGHKIVYYDLTMILRMLSPDR